MRFSERIGLVKPKITLEKSGISQELRNSLWTLILELIIDFREEEKRFGDQYSDLAVYFRDLWIIFFKLPIDNLPWSYGNLDKFHATKIVRNWFFENEWNLIFEFVEFSSTYHPAFKQTCNIFLKIEMSAYRFVDDVLVEINSEEEVIEIENAIKVTSKFNSVKTHLSTALTLLSNRKHPDFRNSIKESISAVEALAKIITNNENTTLGQALKIIESKHGLPSSLKNAFSSLYGFTSSNGGIRHSLLEGDVMIEFEEARFMLIACSAFINYLISKLP
jgi:hypothetical protein